MQFSLEKGGFLHALPTWVHGLGLRLLQPPVPLPAACQAERVNAFQDGRGLKKPPPSLAFLL